MIPDREAVLHWLDLWSDPDGELSCRLVALRPLRRGVARQIGELEAVSSVCGYAWNFPADDDAFRGIVTQLFMHSWRPAYRNFHPRRLP